MNLDDLRAFARIADMGNLSAAARSLGAPKSSVSRSLARLETDLGVVLLERGARAMRLTDAGRLFLAHARRILGDVEEAEAALDGLVGRPTGTLRINAAVTFALGLVAPMLPAFIRRYPDVRVVLEAENRLVDMAREEVDVAIRIGALPDSDLIARRLGTIELWPCASPGYLAERGTPQTVDELAGHALLGWADAPQDWAFTGPGGEERRVRVPVGTLVPEPAVMQVVLTGGAGIGRLPDFLAHPLVERGALVHLLPRHRSQSVEAHAVYPSHRSLSAKVRVFIDALVEHVRLGSDPSRAGRGGSVEPKA